MRRDVFQAIADPVRREIIQIISEGPMNLNAIAERFEISRPAISKHVKILKECGLVSVQKDGRESICKANLQSLNRVSLWVEQYRKFWSSKLDDLENFLNQEAISGNIHKPLNNKQNEE